MKVVQRNSCGLSTTLPNKLGQVIHTTVRQSGMSHYSTADITARTIAHRTRNAHTFGLEVAAMIQSIPGCFYRVSQHVIAHIRGHLHLSPPHLRPFGHHFPHTDAGHSVCVLVLVLLQRTYDVEGMYECAPDLSFSAEDKIREIGYVCQETAPHGRRQTTGFYCGILDPTSLTAHVFSLA